MDGESVQNKSYFRLSACLVVVFVSYMLFLINGWIVIGSETGNWIYPTIQKLSFIIIKFALFSAIVLTFSAYICLKFVEKNTFFIVAVVLILGIAFQISVRELYPTSLGDIVFSNICTSYYNIATEVSPSDLLQNFETLCPNFPIHGITNMPGKVFLFYCLQLISYDPQLNGILITLLSCLSSLLIFLITIEWFNDYKVAILAMLLSMMYPAKVGLTPLLNVISPMFIMISFLLWLIYLRTSNYIYLFFLSISLYLVLFFDPILFVAGIFFIGAIFRDMEKGHLSLRYIFRSVLILLAGVITVNAVISSIFGFDAFSSFATLMRNANSANQQLLRPYSIWIIQNLKEFFLNAGVLSSFLLLASLGATLLKIFSTWKSNKSWLCIRKFITLPGTNLLLFFIICLLCTDMIGIVRGEATRILMFMSDFLQILCAWLCIRCFSPAICHLVVASVAFQAVITAYMIGFLICY